jgi:ADP-heptose:LPS heptosyltransferase
MEHYYAIVLTGSFGDVLNATPIAAQLKQSPKNKVHWYVSSRCKGALLNNPHIDKIIVIEAKDKPSSTIPATQKALKQARAKGIYKKIIAPAPYYRPFWNTQKIMIIECIKKAAEEDLGVKKWTVPWRPVLNLTGAEIKKARAFMATLPKKPKVLFEYQAESGQSHFRPKWIKPICDLFGDDWVIILSGKKPKFELPKNAVDGSVLSIRETVEAYKHVDFVVGVASGVTCACASSWADEVKVPWVESCNNKLWSGENFPHKPRSICYSKNLNDFLQLLKEVKNG